MIKYLNLMVYTTEDGDAASSWVVADRHLSLNEVLYCTILFLSIFEDPDDLAGNVVPFESLKDTFNPFGVDHFILDPADMTPVDTLPDFPDWLDQGGDDA